MTEVIDNNSDFEKYLKDTKKVVEEALDFSLGPENPEILRESMRYSLLALSLIHISEPTRPY